MRCRARATRPLGRAAVSGFVLMLHRPSGSGLEEGPRNHGARRGGWPGGETRGGRGRRSRKVLSTQKPPRRQLGNSGLGRGGGEDEAS